MKSPHCMDSEGKSSVGVACRNNLLMQEGIGEKRYEELETDWKEKVRQEKVACWHAENVWSSCHQLGLPPLIFNPFQCTASCSIQCTALRYKVPMRSLHCSAFFTQNVLYVRSSDYHLILLPPIPMHCYGISQMYSLLYTVDKLAHLTVNFVLKITNRETAAMSNTPRTQSSKSQSSSLIKKTFGKKLVFIQYPYHSIPDANAVAAAFRRYLH